VAGALKDLAADFLHILPLRSYSVTSMMRVVFINYRYSLLTSKESEDLWFLLGFICCIYSWSIRPSLLCRSSASSWESWDYCSPDFTPRLLERRSGFKLVLKKDTQNELAIILSWHIAKSINREKNYWLSAEIWCDAWLTVLLIWSIERRKLVLLLSLECVYATYKILN
jgi:hypothetical protein